MIKINQITKEDTNIIYNLNQTIFKDEVIYNKNFIENYCINKLGFLAKMDNIPCGYILYGNSYTHELNASVCTIISIGILNKYRRKGIGSKLLKSALQILSNYDVYLHVRVTNKSVQQFYVKEGFVIISRVPKYYNLIKDGIEDAFLMKKKSLKLALKELLKKKKDGRIGKKILL